LARRRLRNRKSCGPARASLPVPFVFVGCITGGKFTKEGRTGPNLVSPELLRLEGKTVRIEGWLSPGDFFKAQAVFVVDEQCRADLHKHYFLCDPCQTTFDAPSSVSAPKQEDGTVVTLPPEAIREFDNYNARMTR
jgi:hypothetical protein